MKFKKIITLGLVLAMTSTMLFGCGCSINSDTPIIGTFFGLEDDEVFKVDKLICKYPEYMIQVLDYANRYKAGLGGKADWNQKVTKEQTLSQYIMDKVKEDMSVKYTIASMAKEKQVTISNAEETAIKQAASEYYSSLSDDEKEFTKAKEKDVEKVYKNFKLADKVFEKVTEDQDATVSDEETRAAKVYYIRMDSTKHKLDYINKTLDFAYKCIKNNYQPFSREARQFSDDDTFERIIYKNEAKRDWEKKVFDMESGTVVKSIKDGNDYYLVKCIDNYLKEESLENKQRLIDQNKKEFFNKEYKKYLEDVSTDFNSSSIEDVTLESTNNFTNYSLITIYDKKVK